jgi:hypothetical protein
MSKIFFGTDSRLKVARSPISYEEGVLMEVQIQNVQQAQKNIKIAARSP